MSTFSGPDQDAPKNITATFSQVGYVLNLSKVGSGSVNVGGTLHSLPWSDTFTLGTEVTLEAVPDSGWYFAGWAGDASGVANPIAVTMDTDRSITATFTQTLYALNVSAVGNGSIEGEQEFYGWSGDASGTDMSVTLTMDADKAVSAEFMCIETFPDVPCDHWAYSSVEYTAVNNVVEGYPSGDYQPARQVNRAQMAVFIARSIVTPTGEAGLEPYEAPEVPTFSDVPTTYWSYRHVEYLVEIGTVVGYPDGLYRPGKTVTRAQMAVYLGRCFDLLD